MNDSDKSLKNKKIVKQLLDKIANDSIESLKANLIEAYHPDAHWRGSHPMNELTGITGIEEVVWKPLHQSFPDLERRDTLLIAGTYEERDYVGAVGHYAGTFKKDWLGIPANNDLIYLRYGEFHHVLDGKIIQSTVLIDVLDVIRQAGIWPLSKSTGSEEMWPSPITGDGIDMESQDPAISEQSLTFTLGMHKSLANEIIDREGLLNMSQRKFWHPKMMWYGPCGIGTTRGLEGFVDYHQVPFRLAFPKREYGKFHYVRIGDGYFTATAGWPSIHTWHEGGNWLGITPTGNKIEMRVMDFYLIHEGMIRENWVPIDIIHILLQMGVDIMSTIEK